MKRLCQLLPLASLLLSACASRDTVHADAAVFPGSRPTLTTPSLTGTQDCAGKPPVILIHGTFANFRRTFSLLDPLIESRGRCVFGINYGAGALPGVFAINDMRRSAEQLSAFIQQVMVETGTSKVILVGHSQGGTLAFYLANQLGLHEHIDKLVAIAPSIRGTTVAALAPAGDLCTACRQQAVDAEFIRNLAAGGYNPHGLRVLILATRNDKVVVPWRNQLIDEPQIDNVLLQDMVPKAYASHSGIMRNPQAMRFVADWIVR